MKGNKKRIISIFIFSFIVIALSTLTTLSSAFAESGAKQWYSPDLNSLSEADWAMAFDTIGASQPDFHVESVEEFKAITKYYDARIRDGVEVHRFRLKNTDAIQCILIHTQGSLSVAGSRPESIRLAPNVEPIDTTSRKQQVGKTDIGILFGLDGLPDEDGNIRTCPDGSFPRVMPKLQNLYRFQKLEDIYRKYPKKATSPVQMPKGVPLDNLPHGTNTSSTAPPNGAVTPIQPPDATVHEYAHASRLVNNTGSSAHFNIWSPYVEPRPSPNDEFSLSQLWVPAGTGDNMQTVEAGWQVYNHLYGDNNPHLFIYFTTHYYNISYPGCYNLDCQGFVQTNSNVVIGGYFSSVSTIGGNQYGMDLMYLRDAGGSHHWWLKFEDQWVGYYPNSLFNSSGIANYSDRVDYGGEIINRATGGLHTTTDMGSGRFPSEGWQYAAYINRLKYVDMNNFLQDSSGLNKDVTNASYYDLELYSSTDPNWLQHFYFGGPGRIGFPVMLNLTPYQPPGWSDKTVVSNVTGTNTDSSPLYTTDTLYVDWAVINNGNASISKIFSTQLYIDGILKATWQHTNLPMDANTSQQITDYSIGSLSAGTHTLKIVTDSTGVIDESNEADNEYTKTIMVQAVNYYVKRDGHCADKTPCFATIQAGIDSAQTFTIINITQETYNENIIFDDPKVLTLQGGWDLTFTAIQSNTTINGSLTISNGSLILDAGGLIVE